MSYIAEITNWKSVTDLSIHLIQIKMKFLQDEYHNILSHN